MHLFGFSQLCIFIFRRPNISHIRIRSFSEGRILLQNICSSIMKKLKYAMESEQSLTLTHSGEKSNKCNQCDYASSQAGHLETHLEMHSGEKSNKCSQCDFTCSQAFNLRRHLKTHNGEKPNKCNQCDFALSQAGNLRAHFKTHSGEK